jgi:hypothetical protein
MPKKKNDKKRSHLVVDMPLFLKERFKLLCESRIKTISEVTRELIKNYCLNELDKKR